MNFQKKQLTGSFCAALVVLSLIGCGEDNVSDGGTSSVSEMGTTDLLFDDSEIVSPLEGLPTLEGVDPDYTPALENQTLPSTDIPILELDKVSSFVKRDVTELESLLREHGVVRQAEYAEVNNPELMAEAVSAIAESYDEPGVFLTSDALFNTFHNFFDNMLLGIELQTLRPRMLAMLGALKISASKMYNSLPAGDTKNAALDVVAYLQTAQTLMSPNSPMLAEVKDVVDAEINNIMKHNKPGTSPIFDRLSYSVTWPKHPEVNCKSCDPCEAECGVLESEDLFVHCPERYCEDYTQYVPRGHYTYNEDLKDYFRAVMWLGRMTFFNKSPQSTRGAVILMDAMKNSTVKIDDKDVSAVALWRQFFSIIGTFVGSAEDLNISDINGVVTKVLGVDFSLEKLDDAANITAIQDAVKELRDPAILSGIINSRADAAAETKGTRLLGQVFLPDTLAFTRLIYTNVGASNQQDGWEPAALGCGISVDTDPETLTFAQTTCVCDSAFFANNWSVCKGMPSALDMAASFGSERARDLALDQFDQYAHYPSQLSDMISEIDDYDLTKWGISVTWTWLYAIKGMFENDASGIPAFMRTEAWADKTLETGATSWAEMRHDTVLYAKQSYTPGMDSGCAPGGDGDTDYNFNYVEPQPEAYSRLAAAAHRLSIMALDAQLFSDDSQIHRELSSLVQTLERAVEISIKEMQGEELSNGDVYWIGSAGSMLFHLENNLLDSLNILGADQEPDPDRLKTTIITDVHTWAYKKKVLEVGSGFLEDVVILHQLPGGQWGVAVGPAFSFHEFEHPMSDRLTDEAWRDNLITPDPTYGEPDWLQ